VTVGYRNGKRVRKTFYGETRGDLQEQLKKTLRDQQLGLPIAVERQTVAQFITNWLENAAKHRLRPKTVRRYEQLTAHHIAPSIGHVELSKLTPQQVQEVLNGIVQKGPLAPHSPACSCGASSRTQSGTSLGTRGSKRRRVG